MADAQYPVHWRGLTCVFEYELRGGDKKDVRAGTHSLTISNDDL